jgi:hypothetical protein
MNKATLNRRNRERRAKRNKQERGESLTGFDRLQAEADAGVDAEVSSMLEEQFGSLDEAPKPKKSASSSIVVAKPKEQKSYNLGDPGEGREWIINEDNDEAILFDTDTYQTKGRVSLSEAKAGDNVPQVSSAVEEALAFEGGAADPMDDPFLMDEPVVSGTRMPFDADTVFSSPSYLRAQADMMEAAGEAGLDGAPRDPRMRSEMFMAAAPEEFEVAAQGPAMQEVAAQELMQELEARKGLGQADFVDLYDEIQRGMDRIEPVGATDGRPNRRRLERDLSVKVGGRRIPAVLANRILDEYRADYNRIRAGRALGYGHGGRRDRGVRR